MPFFQVWKVHLILVAFLLVIGILALAATQQYYPLSAVSQVVLPALCVLTSDPEREVRDHAFKVIKGFLGKLEKVSEDPSLKESMGKHLCFCFLKQNHCMFCVIVLQKLILMPVPISHLLHHPGLDGRLLQ